VRAHLVQLDIRWEDRDANTARVQSLLAGADVRPGDLVVLPELFDSGFSLNTAATNDNAGRTAAFLAHLASTVHATVQGGRTIIPEGAGRALNLMSVFGPDGLTRAQYAKIHPFSFGKEPDAFAGGDEVVTYRWGPLTCCPAVCYDLRFPELFRLGMKKGAELFAVGANWPAPRQHHWRALLIARAIENQAFVLGVNRAGADPYLQYAGGSIVVDPTGCVLAEADHAETVLSADIDPDAPAAWRARFPALRDARLLP
jgi:predicted amidohydrolase